MQVRNSQSKMPKQEGPHPQKYLLDKIDKMQAQIDANEETNKRLEREKDELAEKSTKLDEENKRLKNENARVHQLLNIAADINKTLGEQNIQYREHVQKGEVLLCSNRNLRTELAQARLNLALIRCEKCGHNCGP